MSNEVYFEFNSKTEQKNRKHKNSRPKMLVD